MTWSRSATTYLGLATAFPLLYLAGFIPVFFFLQDSPNPPFSREGEHILSVIAGFAMATYFVVFFIYLVHVVFFYRGSSLRKFGWFLAIAFAAPVAMVAYWATNVRNLTAPTRTGPGTAGRENPL